MVRVSATAVEFLEESRESRGVPDSHGVRIFGQENQEGAMMVRLAFTDDPDDRDQRIDQHGTDFYVAPEVVEPLGEAVIDMAPGEESQLMLRQQVLDE